jgi:transcription antitermination protein NusB
VEKNEVISRKKARRLILQALYQWNMTGEELTEIDAQFRANNDMQKIDSDFFAELLYKIPSDVEAIDLAFEPLLDRKKQDLNPVELAILRIGAYELIHRLDVPYKVVINESICLAKEYGASDGHKYINGILDKLAEVYRKLEMNEY